MGSKWQLERKTPGDFLASDLRSEREAAQELGLSASALRALRAGGLPFLRVGRLVRYDMPSVVCWLLNNCDGSVSDLTGQNEEGAN